MKIQTSIRRFALAAAAVAALASPARASILTSGSTSFRTGTPTPTLTINAPISIPITTSGGFVILAFDEWVTNDGSVTRITPSPTVQNINFTLAGTTSTSTIGSLRDNGINEASLTFNDGYIVFGSTLAVTAGQTLVIQPGSFTFVPDANFNPNLPTNFTGNVYITDGSGNALSGLTSVGNVPEPSTWAFVAAGAGLLGFATLRRRRDIRLA